MRVPGWTHSLKWRIVATYSLILILGGVSTSVIGIRVTGRALLQQARQQVDHGLAAARMIYLNRLHELRLCVELLADSGHAREALGVSPPPSAIEYLNSVRERRRLDFPSVADPTGKVVLRTAGGGTTDDTVTKLAPVAQALAGGVAVSTEIIPLATLRAEDPAIAQRAAIELIPTPKARPKDEHRLDSGMALLAAAPVTDQTGQVIAVLYAGQLLNESDPDAPEGSDLIVDQIKGTVFPGVQFQGRPAGAA